MSESLDIEKIVNTEMGFDDALEETEEDSVDEENEQPFDADKIRIDQQMLSLKYVYDLYKDKDEILKLNPDFQRGYVWENNRKKSLLIESIMLRIPIPAFYFYEKKDGTFNVIDGQQRLHTIFDFIEGKFALSGLEYLGDKFNKKKFDELDPKYKQRINRTQLAVNILDERSPQKVIFDIFRRINTGGMPLAPQEMRNAICNESVRNFLKAGAESVFFKEATRNKISDFRMAAQEMFLRFITLYRRYDFEKSELFKLRPSKMTMLMDAEINEIAALSEDEKNDILKAFEISMKKCRELFGDYAFVKIVMVGDTFTQKKDLINKPLFSAFSVLLANPKLDVHYSLSDKSDLVLSVLAKKLTDDQMYQKSITTATGDESNLKTNFKKSREVLEECQIL